MLNNLLLLPFTLPIFPFLNPRLEIKEKIGAFTLWKNCCCKKASRNEISIDKYSVRVFPDVESEADVTKENKQKRVHFSNVQEVITIPPRTAIQRIWRPLMARINYAFHNFAYYLCYPCVIFFQYIFKGNSPEYGEAIQSSSRTERNFPTSN